MPSALHTHLPTGTVTFLFTDIEGSTKMWEAHRDAMQHSLERHDALLRNAIMDAGGVVFKTVGDAFCAAFPDAPSALVAATQAQIALNAEPWPDVTPIRVRMALHTGLAQERDSDYFGPVLNRVARLLSAGHGGQALLSAASYELMRDTLPPEVGLFDLGSHRLKDLERPEHVYQVMHPALAAAFSPLKTLDTTPNNLPQQVTSFIGREKPIADVTTLLGKARLVTLTGSGGSGKTRLSLQVAADVLDAYPDGVWQVELAPLSDPSLVPQTIAQVLGIKEAAGQTMTQTLVSGLKDKTLLLVLDNCEHLLSACSQLAAALLRACPTVKVLATSREPLGIGGEQTYRVPTLTLPTQEQGKKATVKSVSQFEAVRLFIDRAQAVKPDFAVTNTNAPALAQLCYRLDGIPLAIELAAARVRSLPVEQINDKLDTRFRILTGGDKAALPRQQTLRALVDWSYDLLTDTEKMLFARLSVFAGGWTLAAAESVCGYEPVEDWEVLDLLTSLADKSLLVADEDTDAGETRYRLLETLKQYGAEKREASGESRDVTTKFRDYFVAFAEEAEPQLTGPGQVLWLTRLETEHDNLRSVLDECAAPSAAPSEEAATSSEEAGLRLVGALWWFWNVRGYLTEGREQGTRALERGPGQKGQPSQQLGRLRAKAMTSVGNLASNQGDYTVSRSLYEESLGIYRELGSKGGIASVLHNLGNVACGHGDYATARSLFEEGLALQRELGNKWGITIALTCLGNVAGNQGDYAVCRSLYEESLALSRELGDKENIATALGNLGTVALIQGDYTAARLLLEESLDIFRELGSKDGIANMLNNLGEIASNQGDCAVSWSLFEESLGIYRELGNNRGIAYGLEGFALLYLGKSAFQEVVTLFGAANALRESLGAPLSPFEQEQQATRIATARLALDEAAFSAAWEQGRAMTGEQAADYALRVGGGEQGVNAP